MSALQNENPAIRPRIGFLGVGRIGRLRMESLLDSGLIDAVGIADPSPDMAEEAARLVPETERAGSFNDLLSLDLDGLVIATPSALHAEQAITALERGLAVFCQKPLGRTAAEVAAVVEAAERNDRLLGVDLSYRHLQGVERIRELLAAGELGHVFSIDLTFHNAYGPDKPWFYDRALSGGGCVVDLGVHLVDLALWSLDFPAVRSVTSHLKSGGQTMGAGAQGVEDFAVATVELETGTILRLACSWHLHAGRDAVIEAQFYGDKGGASFSNVGGSFLDFRADRFSGTRSEPLAEGPDAWSGRAACAWARRLAKSRAFDPEARGLVRVSEVLDAIYANA